LVASRPRPKNIKSRRRRSERRTDSRFTPDELDKRLASTQKWILLLAAFVVPLIVLPESNFIDITSIPKTSSLRILGSLQAGVMLSRLLLRFTDGTDDPRQTIRTLLAPIRVSKPATFILGSITAVVVVSLISTVLSIVPHQSWWGRNPSGFESGEFSALMYVILAISAFITVRESRNSSILWQSLAVTGIAAGLVGFLQYFEISPLDISATQGERITGTNGNPIFFGAMLIMLAPVTIGLFFQRYQTSVVDRQKFWLAAIAVSSFLLSFSIIATLSRGPWLGLLIGGIAFVIMVAILVRSKAFIVPFIVMIVFIGIGITGATIIDRNLVPISETDPDAAEEAISAKTISRLGSAGTLSTRFNYWSLASEMALKRDTVPFTEDSPKIVRWLFGYGPDTFRFTGTQFSDGANLGYRLTTAHSDPFNRLAEQGFLGIISWIALWSSLLYGLISLLKRHSKNSKDASVWMAITLTTALGARFVEQLSGSPTPGGILVFWLIVGGLLAMLVKTGDVTPKRKILATHPSQPVKYVAFSGVALIALVSVIFAYDKGASYLLAAQSASFLHRPHIIEPEDAIDRLERSVSLAPDYPFYWHGLADIQFGFAENTSDPDEKLEALTRAYEYELKAYEINPLEIGEIYELAFASWELGKTGLAEYQQITIELYERLIILRPSDPLPRERLISLNEYIANNE
jgi:O-antigen ligase